MYVFKNALKNIIRAKGRNILVFVLVLVIALSSCIALSIQNSAEKAKSNAYENMTISAQIMMDRNSLMGGGANKGDMESMQEIMEKLSTPMSLDELSLYSSANSVYDFYYTSSIGANATEEDGVSVYELTSSGNSQMPNMGQGGMGGMGSKGDKGGSMGMTLGKSSGDFNVTGYSSHNAMTSFIEGTITVTSGAVFSENDSTNACLISQEIATLNDFSVGDTFTLVNSLNENDTIDFTIDGIFYCESTDSFANDIYVSFASIESICANSENVATTYTDERTGLEKSTAFTLYPNATYVFSDPTSYETFQTEVSDLGLDTEIYSITSTDVAEFESSLLPLENLSSFTMLFFIVVLVIGAIILIVFNLFTIRERKYEIGVLSAIGMPKPKVAIQFISEVIIVTFVAVLVGAGIGAVASNPIGESLLASQVESVQTESSNINQNFGGKFEGRNPSNGGMGGMGMPNGGMFGGMGGNGNADVSYIDTLSTSTDLIVLLQLMGIGLALSIIASSVGVISILRYEPLKILSERA